MLDEKDIATLKSILVTKEDLGELKQEVKALRADMDTVAQTTATILNRLDTVEENMTTKKDLALTEFRLQSQISGIETDLKSFKQEIRN